MKRFDILKYKNKDEIIKIVNDLGSHKLTSTSHSYKEFGEIEIF